MRSVCIVHYLSQLHCSIFITAEDDDSRCGETASIYPEQSKSILHFPNWWDCHSRETCEAFFNVIPFSEIASHWDALIPSSLAGCFQLLLTRFHCDQQRSVWGDNEAGYSFKAVANQERLGIPVYSSKVKCFRDL